MGRQPETCAAHNSDTWTFVSAFQYFWEGLEKWVTDVVTSSEYAGSWKRDIFFSLYIVLSAEISFFLFFFFFFEKTMHVC